MTSKERVLQREKDRGYPVRKLQGKADALDLAQRAETMDGGHIWRKLFPDNVYRPTVLPERWEDLGERLV